ncbi:MAG: hypothetical protein ABFS28_01555 [Bacteroidota bacterium]
MLKRFIYAGLFAVVCVGLILVFLLNRFDKITPLEILEAVPEDAILFIEDIDYEYLTETFLAGSRLWVDYVNTTGQTELDSLLQVLLTQVNSEESMKDILKKEGFHLSLHLVGKDQLVPLFYLKYPESYSDHEFENLLISLLEEKAMINSRKYETETLYDVSGEPGLVPGTFTFSCMKGMCLLSSSSMLIEESIRTIHNERDLNEELGLSMVKATAGRYVHAKVYINYERLPYLFYPFTGETSWDKLGLFSQIASWGELDLDVKPDALIFNGMTYTDPNSSLFLGAFADQSPVKMEIHKIMPSGTSYFLHLGISDRAKFREQITAYLAGIEEGPDVEAELHRLEETYGIDPLGDLAKIMDDELAWFAIEGKTEEPGDELLVIETRSRSETMEVIMRWVEQYLQVNAFDMSSMRHVYQLDDQTSFNIYRLPDPFFKGTPAGRMFNSYFTIYENYLIFGPTVDILSRVIYQNVLHKNFVSDPMFKEMSDYLSNRSNITLFLRPFSYLDYKRNMLSDPSKKKMESLELFLRRIPGVVLQFSTEDRLFYQSISCKYTSQIRDKALTVWESLLDSAAANKPALVVNHNTSEKEILVQDEANKVYLINSTGRILWKLPLEGPVMGKIHQVDFYKNGRLQYLFNTSDKIHLIDRNGNYVERYPIALRSAASNALALFDYDKNRDYRLFVATDDRKIYVYDIEGKLITGWKFGKTESLVTGEIKHFRISEKDYIVVSDRNRTYFLDRRGRDRIKVSSRIAFSPQNPPTLDMNEREEKPRWVSTDTSGNVMAIYLDGTVSTLLSQKVSGDHFFRMGDFDKDGIPEFIFADGDELSVLYQDGNRLFTYRVREKISHMPDIYKFSASDVKIGITDRARNRIYLINSDGSLYEGFPLEGSTRFSIGYFAGSDSRFNLIVGSTNNFLYNYSIE